MDGGKSWNILGILNWHLEQRYSFIEYCLGGFPLGLALKQHGLSTNWHLEQRFSFGEYWLGGFPFGLALKQYGLSTNWHFEQRSSFGEYWLGGFSLGLTLKQRGLSTSNGFFCIVRVDDSAHHFIQYMIACHIWIYISQIWRVLSRCYLTPRQWMLHNSHNSTQNQRWRSFSYFWDIGECIIIGIYTMFFIGWYIECRCVEAFMCVRAYKVRNVL